jgi:hypothetical protein
MPEIRYTVASTFPDDTTAQAWLRWLKEGHIADVMRGGATSAEVFHLSEPPQSYEVAYRFPSMTALEKYLAEFAPALRAEGLQRFPPEKGITTRRQIAEVVG